MGAWHDNGTGRGAKASDGRCVEFGLQDARSRPARPTRNPLLLALTLALAAFGGVLGAKGGTPEYEIKAAYLLKFTPFVEWPASAFAGPSSPFSVCVLGGDPFGADIDRTLKGRTVADHPVQVRRLQTLDGAEDCQILYFGTLRAPAAAAALSKVRGTPVLTVTEQSLGVSGGVVQFMVVNDHVRFSIDAGAAAANHMVISAKLLSLAASFKPDRQP